MKSEKTGSDLYLELSKNKQTKKELLEGKKTKNFWEVFQYFMVLCKFSGNLLAANTQKIK
jgi:hypothetical protein